MRLNWQAGLLAWLTVASTTFAQNEAVLLQEMFPVGYHYHVRCRVQIQGELSLGNQKNLPVVGASKIEYDEKVLTATGSSVEKTLRLYRQMDFERKVGSETQQSGLRPEVRRMVLLRHQHLEVPFSPTAPMKWSELDLVRTDVFTPALLGLLPRGAVRPGQSWRAEESALKELTDLDQLQESELVCTLESIAQVLGRPQAKVSLKGSVRGIGEDGPARHQLEGFLYFDLQGKFLSYMTVKGIHTPLDPKGQPQGRIEGTFVLDRQPTAEVAELTSAALQGLKLDPDDDNTLLLHEEADAPIRFLYPRRWRISQVKGPQIVLDERQGSGLLISLEQPASKVPGPVQFQQEVNDWLTKEKAKVFQSQPPRVVQLRSASMVDHFAYDVQLAGQRLHLDYYVIKTPLGGATFAGRLAGPNLAALQKDLERMARSFQMGR